jgi:hypothetical protein
MLNLRSQLLAKRSNTTPFQVRLVPVHSQVVTLQWVGEPNRQYQIESSTNLKSWGILQ